MAKKAKGGGKLSRSETVVFRLEPKLKYISEIASRKQRRSLSSYIESAIESSLKNMPSGLTVKAEGDDLLDVPFNMYDMMDILWHPDEVIRFLRLQVLMPSLLTYEEQIIWEMICEMDEMWVANVGEGGKLPGNVMEVKIDVLRKKWKDLKAKATQGDLEWSSIGMNLPDTASPIKQKFQTSRLIMPSRHKLVIKPDNIFNPPESEKKKKPTK